MLAIINPNHRNPSPFAACEPPLWASLIAGYNPGSIIIDAEADNLTIKETVKIVPKDSEVLICVMGNNPSVSSTPKMEVATKLLAYLPEAKLTGLHPIAVDYPGVVKEPFKGTPKIPWKLLNLNLYKAHNWHTLGYNKGSPYGVLYTSLNCPFTCYYCNINTLYGDRKIRYRPLEDIFEDLDYFALHGIHHIKIWDELFAMNPGRVIEICDYIISHGYNFNFWAYARVDTINQKMLRKMKQAGINWLAYGFESDSEDVRRLSRKGYVESESHKAVNMTRENGINIMGNFIFGLPGDNEQSMNQTFDMALKANFEYVNFYVGLPYPGSQWHKDLVERASVMGYEMPADWQRFSQYNSNMYADSKVVAFRDAAFMIYFSRNEYQSMIEKKIGTKAKESIQEMLKFKFR